ncbi:MAG: SpoIID/LytB domain-containing protein [Oscillospiraceae bacterium]
MSVLIRAGILALGAVLLIPSGSARGEAAPQETLLLVVEAPSAKETITILRDGDAQEEDFETYLTQVVLSEMPADFATEALKAQAVAARTFARRQMAGGKHADADVCSQSACCQACLSADALQERYDAAFDAAWDKASNAVQQTQDEVLTYSGALIDAVYFSCSGGSTEAAAAVWGTDVPYLQAVDSPGEQDAARMRAPSPAPCRICRNAQAGRGRRPGRVARRHVLHGGRRRGHLHDPRTGLHRYAAAAAVRAQLHALFTAVRGRRLPLRRARLRPPRRHEPIRRQRHRPPRFRLSNDPALLLPRREDRNAKKAPLCKGSWQRS